MDAGASAPSGAPPGPNNIEKTTNTCARGESSVQPKSGETSKRVLLVGFHAIVGPTTKLLSGSPRVSLSVKLRYCISTPAFRRSCSSQIGITALCAKPIRARDRNRFPARKTNSLPIRSARRNLPPTKVSIHMRQAFWVFLLTPCHLHRQYPQG